MKAALIRDGKIVEMIIADTTFCDLIAPLWDDIKDVSAISAGIGWDWDDTTKVLSSPQKTDEDKPVIECTEQEDDSWVEVQNEDAL